MLVVHMEGSQPMWSTIWNDLPARMNDPSLNLDSFRKLLQTFLFDK